MVIFFFLLLAIYMDPRFQVLLVPEFKNKAQNHICKLWNLICALKNNSGLQEEVQETQTITIESLSSADNDTDDFELFLRAKSGSS